VLKSMRRFQVVGFYYSNTKLARQKDYTKWVTQSKNHLFNSDEFNEKSMKLFQI